MRLYTYPMVLLIGLLCVASRASAQKETHGKPSSGGGARGAVGDPPHGGVGNAGHDHHAARNDEGRRGGGVGGKSQNNAHHVDRVPVPKGAARTDGQKFSGTVNNPQHRAGSARANPGSANARGAPNANIAGQNAWRYRQQNNRWWYWTPNNSWVYWNNGAWVPYGSLAVGGSRNYGGRYPYASGYRGTATSTGGYLGVTFDKRSPNAAVIAQVRDDSPAAHAGLQPGDAIRAINGESIQSPYRPSELIGHIAAGTKISLAIERDRQTSDVLVVLGQR
jgi:hypothetical protein